MRNPNIWLPLSVSCTHALMKSLNRLNMEQFNHIAKLVPIYMSRNYLVPLLSADRINHYPEFNLNNFALFYLFHTDTTTEHTRPPAAIVRNVKLRYGQFGTMNLGSYVGLAQCPSSIGRSS